MGYFIFPLWCSLTLTSVFLFSGLALADQSTIRIYAAASLTSVMKKIGEAAERYGLPPATFVHAASSTLARQIERGAPSDLYISANSEWVDYLIKRKFKYAIPRTFAGNEIVLIAPVHRPLNFSFKIGKPLAQVIGSEWMALADPDHVPAGIYAKAALLKLGHWKGLKSRIARAPNVRAALALVIREETRSGIVYMSDVVHEARVHIVAKFPKGSYPKIFYMALDLANTKDSRLYTDFLLSETVAVILTENGFYPPKKNF